MNKGRIVITLFLCMISVFSVLVYQEKQQFDYFYVGGQYYSLTAERLKDLNLRGNVAGTITRNTNISPYQRDGDSNVLPIGSTIYSIDSPDHTAYRYALTYYHDGMYRIARLHVSDIADWSPEQSS